MATYFPAPHSYTGEDIVEISAHGSPVVLRQIVEQAMQAGARLAEPGEFTLRAFLNGRIDLVQAEAVADLIDAVTPLQARAAFDQLEGTLTERIGAIDAELFDLIARLEASLDFPDEGYHFVEAGEAGAALRSIESQLGALLCEAKRGRLIREGARVAIVGKPNVGKSSLFNALLRAGRSIVTPFQGRREILLRRVPTSTGLRLELIDTAGSAKHTDEVEMEGVARARRAWTTADLVLVVLDLSRPLDSARFRVAQRNSARPPRGRCEQGRFARRRGTTPSVSCDGGRVFGDGEGLDELRRRDARLPSKVEARRFRAIRRRSRTCGTRRCSKRARRSLRRAVEAVDDPSRAGRRRVRADGFAGRARGAGRSDGQADVRRCVAAYFFAVLHWKIDVQRKDTESRFLGRTFCVSALNLDSDAEV